MLQKFISEIKSFKKCELVLFRSRYVSMSLTNNIPFLIVNTHAQTCLSRYQKNGSKTGKESVIFL